MTESPATARPTLRPGVVTGAEYDTLVAAAKAGGYALPAVNVTGTNTINAVLEAAAANRSDVVVQLSNGGAQFYAGQGLVDAALAKVHASFCTLVEAQAGADLTDYNLRRIGSELEGFIRQLLQAGEIRYNPTARVQNFSMGLPRTPDSI